MRSVSGNLKNFRNTSEFKRNAGIKIRRPKMSENVKDVKVLVGKEIKILGPGCDKCHEAEKVVREALAESGTAANLEKVEDPLKIAEYGVFGTPAVVIDGEVKIVGKLPKKEDVLNWLK
jgi:small redox-active disulfide protein 2